MKMNINVNVGKAAKVVTAAVVTGISAVSYFMLMDYVSTMLGKLLGLAILALFPGANVAVTYCIVIMAALLAGGPIVAFAMQTAVLTGNVITGIWEWALSESVLNQSSSGGARAYNAVSA